MKQRNLAFTHPTKIKDYITVTRLGYMVKYPIDPTIPLIDGYDKTFQSIYDEYMEGLEYLIYKETKETHRGFVKWEELKIKKLYTHILLKTHRHNNENKPKYVQGGILHLEHDSGLTDDEVMEKFKSVIDWVENKGLDRIVYYCKKDEINKLKDLIPHDTRDKRHSQEWAN